MALAGAIATLEWIRRQWKHARVVYVSDSQYLVKGMREWVAGWEARGWKRKGGVLENQELWKKLVQAAAARSEEHTSELQSHSDLVCRLLLEKKKRNK